MKQEDKELLLKDLCGHLLHGVKVRYSSPKEFRTCTLHSINPTYNTVDLWSKDACFTSVDISKIKPYLYPLSSMTEEQKEEFRNKFDINIDISKIFDGIDFCGSISFRTISEIIDWLNENHFDYRGLIERGFAIDCTNLNIY